MVFLLDINAENFRSLGLDGRVAAFIVGAFIVGAFMVIYEIEVITEAIGSSGSGSGSLTMSLLLLALCGSRAWMELVTIRLTLKSQLVVCMRV